MYIAQLSAHGARTLAKALDVDLEPGPHYVTNVNAGEFLAAGFASRVDHVTFPPLPPAPSIPSTERILFVRSGGFGDLLFLTPTLRALASQGHEIHVACFPAYTAVLEHLPFPVHHVTYPIPHKLLAEYRHVVDLEGVVENNQVLHAVDVFARAAGVTLETPAQKKCLFHLTDEEKAAAWERFPRISTETKRLGIQAQASATVRSYPYSALVFVIKMAMKEGWRVFLFGDPGSLDDPPEDVATSRELVNLTSQQPPLSFRESAAVLATCDVVFAPDSALAHIAGALHLPAVAIYGPFHWRQRTAYAPTIRALQGYADCAPCHHHVRAGQEFPEGGPCNEAGYCVAFQKIPPARIIAEITKAYESRPQP